MSGLLAVLFLVSLAFMFGWGYQTTGVSTGTDLSGMILEGGCPPCSEVFKRLKESRGRHFQDVKVEERGEPKSGTAFMLEWAGGALDHTCNYLNALFGRSSCQFEVSTSTVLGATTLKLATLTFRPQWTRADSSCSCSGVDRVRIQLIKGLKHTLPVDEKCPWQHIDNLANEKIPCKFKDGREPQNYEELSLCVEERYCRVQSRGLQLVVFRDPRPMTVSSYFFLKAHPDIAQYRVETVDDYVNRMLPILCQWVGIRYIVFQERLKEQSEIFFYSEALADPLAWHHQFLQWVGLQLPDPLIEAAADAAVRHTFSFDTKGGMDKHPGSLALQSANTTRSYRDDLAQETLDGMDDVLRTWLPPPLLEKFGLEM